MLLIRLLGNALCAAIAAFVVALIFLTGPAHVCRSPATASRMRAIAERTAARDHRVLGGTPVNVLDVAPGVPPAQVAALIQLRPGEHVSAVNDRVPASDLEVGALIASLPRPGEFLDLTVASPAGERRVLVLLH
jgi:hypothetical protein